MRRLAFAFALLSLGACDDDGGGANTDFGGGGDGEAPKTGTAARGLSVVEGAEAAGEGALQIGLESVAAASALGGGVVTTGTLREENGRLAYAAEPADRLVIELAQGTLEVEVRALEGDAEAPDIAAFLDRDHTVELKVRALDGSLDIVVASSRAGDREASGVQGSFRGTDGVLYTVDLRTQGSREVDFGDGTVSYDADRALAGAITAEGFELAVEASETYRSVKVDRFVTNRTREIAHVWRDGDVEFRTQGVRLRTATADGFPTDVESYWVAEGAVLRNGAVHATIGMARAPARIEFFLETAEGREVFETYAVAE